MPHRASVRGRALVASLLLGVAGLVSGAGAAPAFEDTIAQRTRPCTLCHGREGRAGPDGYYPRIAGKPAGYLFNQLRNFRDGRRHYGLMVAMVDPLSDAYLLEIAGYFASLDIPYPPPQPAQVGAADLARAQRLVQQGDAGRGLPACVGCHGVALTGVLPHVPGLLGLPRDYLNGQLGAWKNGQRRAHAPDCMAEVVRRLGDDEIASITGWLAAQALPADTRPARLPPVSVAGAPSLACGSAPALRAAPP